MNRIATDHGGGGRPNADVIQVDHRRLEPPACPLAWWHLHRSLPVGALVELHVGPSWSLDEDGPSRSGNAPSPGGTRRTPGARDASLLADVIEGAGFSIDGHPRALLDGGVELRIRREPTLADTVRPGMRLLLVGLNPSVHAATVGVGFARPGNRAWPAFVAAGLATVDRDPLDLLTRHDIGMTDLVKRATPRAAALSTDEFRHGLRRLDELCRWLRPDAVCVLGVTGWRTATGDRHAMLGPQARHLGGRPVHVAPNPSGLNAHTDVEDLVAHLHTALELGSTDTAADMDVTEAMDPSTG